MANNDRPSAIDICILIPCYNNTNGLIISINSIVYHTGCFLILVVDDGSKKPVTRNELYQHVPITVNIQIIRLKQNQGISRALNKGLEFIYDNYPVQFVARLDCGDTCYPERFFRQVSFLEDHPAIDLLGSWCYFKDARTGAAYKYVTPTQHKSIEHSMYFRNVFIHPTVMWRVSSMNMFRYPENYPHAEDYGLFYDMISKNDATILDDFLVICEINAGGISFQNRFAQLKSRLRVIWHYGKNKFWVMAGSCKLIFLMILPQQLVYRVKKKVYQVKPSVFEKS